MPIAENTFSYRESITFWLWHGISMMQTSKFLLFSAQEDLKTILLQLEEKYNLKYVETVRQGKGSYQETVFDTASAFMRNDSSPGKTREMYLYDRTHRMLLYLGIDTSWNPNRKIAVAGNALEIQNAFGDELYQDFVAKVKEQFVVLSLNDPYFRVNENDEAVHVWRKEWSELLNY